MSGRVRDKQLERQKESQVSVFSWEPEEAYVNKGWPAVSEPSKIIVQTCYSGMRGQKSDVAVEECRERKYAHAFTHQRNYPMMKETAK